MLNRLFRAVEGLTDVDTGFARFVLPQIILQGLLENSTKLIEEVSGERIIPFHSESFQTKQEIVAVLLKTCSMDAGEDCWMRMAAQVVFAILDCLYQWTLLRRGKSAYTFHSHFLNIRSFQTAMVNLLPIHRISYSVSTIL